MPVFVNKFTVTSIFFVVISVRLIKCDRNAYEIFCSDHRRSGKNIDNFIAYIEANFDTDYFSPTGDELTDLCDSLHSDTYADYQWSIGCKRFRKFAKSDLLAAKVKRLYRLERFAFDGDYLNAICDEAHHDSSLWSIACESFKRTSQSRLVIAYAMLATGRGAVGAVKSGYTYNDLNLICAPENNPSLTTTTSNARNQAITTERTVNNWKSERSNAVRLEHESLLFTLLTIVLVFLCTF